MPIQPTSQSGLVTKLQPWKPWIVILSGSAFCLLVFMQMNIFNAIGPQLTEELHLTATNLGAFSACYFYTAVAMFFPAGLILDKYSVKKTILWAVLLMVVSVFGFAISSNFWVMIVCRLLSGVSGAFGLISAIKLATRWFPPRRTGFVIGLVITIAEVGAVIAQTPFTLLADAYSWRSALLINGIVGIAVFALVWLLVSDHPLGREQSFNAERLALQQHSFWQLLLAAIKNTQTWLGGLYTSLLNLPVMLLGATWGGMYLVQAHGLGRAEASYVVSALFVGMMVGSPVSGWISDRLGKRKLPMVISAVLSLLIFLVVMYLPGVTLPGFMVLFFLLGAITGAQIIGYPFIAESSPPYLIATANGLASILIIGGGFLTPVFGWLMDWQWHHKIVNNMPIYSAHDYHNAFMIMLIGFVLGIVAALLVKETHCKNITEKTAK